MTRKLLIAIVCCMLSFVSFSQNAGNEVLYLKNGSIILGTIVEQIPFQTIKIQTSDGSIFVYQTSECDRIEKPTTQQNPTAITQKETEWEASESDEINKNIKTPEEELIEKVLKENNYLETDYLNYEEVMIGDVVKFISNYGEILYGVVKDKTGKNMIAFVSFPTAGQMIINTVKYKNVKHISY